MDKALQLIKKLSGFIAMLAFNVVLASSAVNLHKVNNNINDQKSLQNGAKLFMSYCSGCHSLKYMRYSRLAKDLQVSETLIKQDWLFGEQKIGNKIISAMPIEFAVNWFGIAVPDLSLTARSRGVDWIYTYLRSFYNDESRPFGVNNHLIPGVAMPNILEHRQSKLETSAFDNEIRDIVNFLDYVSEPAQLKRIDVGINVLLFLTILLILSYLLKREYWKDIKYGHWRAR